MSEGNNRARDRHVIKRGFDQIEANVSGDRIVVTKRKRRHTFGEGYEAVGPTRVIYEGSLEEAAYVSEILSGIFHSEGDDESPSVNTDNTENTEGRNQ